MLTGKTAPVSSVPRRPQKQNPRQPRARAPDDGTEAAENHASDLPAPPQAPGGRLLCEAWQEEKGPPAASQAAQGYRKARGAVSTP